VAETNLKLKILALHVRPIPNAHNREALLEALNYDPPSDTGKIILFEVSGTINATSTTFLYRIDNSYTTIAGQTAPNPGISLRNIDLACLKHDVVVQHIRSRVGDAATGVNPDQRRPMEITCMTGHGDVYNVVYDHCSGSWAIDSSGLFWEESGLQAHDCTWSNSIFSEALHWSLHSKTVGSPYEGHSKGPCIQTGTENFAFVNNLMVSNHSRNPYLRRSTNVVVNNYTYNPCFFNTQIEVISDVLISSIVGNVVEGGPSTVTSAYTNHMACAYLTTASEIYLHDNKCGKDGVGWYTQTSASDWSHVQWYNEQPDISEDVKVLSAPVWPTGLTAMDVGDVVAYVLEHAGARPADRDSVDERAIIHANSGGIQGAIIDSPSDVGGWPVLDENTRTLDIPANPHSDSGDGYTNLEKWLHAYSDVVEGKGRKYTRFRGTSRPKPKYNMVGGRFR